MKQNQYLLLVILSLFSSMTFATSVSWSGRVLTGDPININTDGKVVTYEAWRLPQVESLKISNQFEVKPINKEVSILMVKL